MQGLEPSFRYTISVSADSALTNIEFVIYLLYFINILKNLNNHISELN